MNLFTTIGAAILAVFALAAIMSLPVLLHWDWLMPSIFGLGLKHGD